MIKQLIRLIVVCVFFLCCKNDNDLLSKTVKMEEFSDCIERLFLQGNISCQEYMDYRSYPLTQNVFRGKKLRDLLQLIKKDSTSAFNNNYNFSFDSVKITLSSLVQINDNKVILQLVITNNLKKAIRVSNAKIDLWPSKFSFLGTYLFDELEISTILSDSTITNQLYINKAMIKEDLERIEQPLPSGDYSCINFKLLSLNIDTIP